LSYHESGLENTLAKYEDAVAQVVLDDYLQYLPEKDSVPCIEERLIKRDMPVADAISLVLTYDNYLIRLY